MSNMKLLLYFGAILTMVDFGYLVDPLNLLVDPSKIIVYGYHKSGATFTQTLTGSEMKDYCPLTGNFTLLIHGWTESVSRYWVAPMVSSFLEARGDCVLFMDYSYYANGTLTTDATIDYLGYIVLFAYFDPLSNYVTALLSRIQAMGYNPDNGFIFSFSFGTHIGFQGAYFYSKNQNFAKKIKTMHACDPAGPLFDQLNIIGPLLSPSEFYASSSAKQVQCIHTNGKLIDGAAIGKGTTKRFCHKDIDMGNCGETQDAATDTISSHLLCPLFYISAFNNDFKMVNKPPNCQNQKYAPDVTNKYLVMGFRFDMSAQNGQYYSKTYQPPLYNAP